jgi:hypothetical protein
MIYKLEVKKANKFSRVKGYDGTSKAYQPGFSTKKRELNTGLSEEEEKEFVKLLGLKEGDLTNVLGANGVPVSAFWRNYKLEIPPKGLELNDEIPSDRLAIKILSVSKLVSLGKGRPTSSAIWDLYTEEQAAKDKNAVTRYKKKAYKIMDSMTFADMVKYLTSIGMDVENTNAETVESLVGDKIEVDAKEFVEMVSNPLYEDRAFINRLINNRILRKTGDSIYFNDILLGVSITNAIEFLNKREERNQQIKVALTRELEIINARSNAAIGLESTKDVNVLKEEKEKVEQVQEE